jgi:hypothetical protein
MSGLWRVKSSDCVSGPFPFAELVKCARDGCLATDDLVCEDDGPWRFANSIPGLFGPRAGKLGPISGCPASPRWYCRTMSIELGPLGLDVLSRMVATSQVGPDDQVRLETEFQWRRVRDCIEFPPGATEPQPKKEATRSKSKDIVEAPAVDAWHYRLGAAEHGPMSLDELTDLLSHSGEVAREALIRRHDQPDWIPFSAPAETDKALRSDAVAETISPKDGPANPTSTATIRSRRPRPKFSELVQQNRLLIAGAVMWLLGNSALLFWYSDPYSLERRYLADLERIVDETHAMQSEQIEMAEWKSFRQRSQTSLADVVRGLKSSAAPSKPARQQLLWAARDEIPRILAPDRRSTDADKKVAERLQLVRRLISQP